MRVLTAVVLVSLTAMLAACAAPASRPVATSPGAVSAPESIVTGPGTYQGAAIGAAVGAGAGALVDKNNRWRGALIGGALGTVLGGTVTEIRSRAAREAALQNRPVTYQTEDGWQRVEATPQPATSPRGCRQVQERIYQNGQLVQDTLREVCS